MQQKTALTLGIILLMMLLLCFPNLCLQAGQDGLLLWFNKVLPSLLPFIILVNILIPLDGFQSFIHKSTPIIHRIWHLRGESFFAFFIGLIAGYPMGAKVIKNLFDQHRLTKEEAELTLCFCNNCGPLFIIGTIGTAMLSNTSIGYFLYLIHLLSAFTLSLLLTRHHTISQPPSSKVSLDHSRVNFFSLLNSAVMNAMDTIVCVGGYIILFSVLLSLLTKTPLTHFLITQIAPNAHTQQLLTGLLSALFELSNASYTFSKLPISLLTLAFISAGTGFGGLCVYFQSLFVLENTPINTRPFFFAKCIQGLLSFAFTILLYPLYLSMQSPIHNLRNILYTTNTSCPSFIFYFILALSILFLCNILSKNLFKPHDTSHPFKSSNFPSQPH